MLFRIGINLGDVITEDDDIYGDGVNVAARLQASAPAGGIVISNTVYDQVRNKIAVGFEFLGQLEVKNIDGGVPSYAVRIGASDDSGAAADRQAEWGRSAEQSGRSATVPIEAAAEPTGLTGKLMGTLAVIGAGLAALNLLTWRGVFWAAWPCWHSRFSRPCDGCGQTGRSTGSSARLLSPVWLSSQSTSCPGGACSGRCGRCLRSLLLLASVGSCAREMASGVDGARCRRLRMMSSVISRLHPRRSAARSAPHRHRVPWRAPWLAPIRAAGR